MALPVYTRPRFCPAVVGTVVEFRVQVSTSMPVQRGAVAWECYVGPGPEGATRGFQGGPGLLRRRSGWFGGGVRNWESETFV